MNVLPWMLVAVALILTTMAVSAMSPVLNVVVAATILWYAWTTPAIKASITKFAADFKLTS